MKKFLLALFFMVVSVAGFSQWTSLISGTTNPLFSVFFSDANTGFVVGNSGIILRTTNSGLSWSTLASGTSNNLRSVYFSNTDNGYAVGWYGIIQKTTNCGLSWSSVKS
jgi:photosystem II stability/assembly factor-like uncharacterized protein